MAVLALPPGQTYATLQTVLAGVILTVIGELIRLWAVRHIGAISRTRGERLGPLVSSGPFRYVRNPLYLGNIALWVGFALIARLAWLAPIVLVLLAVEYHAIVRWEEQMLEARLGAAYRAYASDVPRWLPKFQVSSLKSQERANTDDLRLETPDSRLPFSWRETLFSERGTLIAMGAGYLLLWLKARF